MYLYVVFLLLLLTSSFDVLVEAATPGNNNIIWGECQQLAEVGQCCTQVEALATYRVVAEYGTLHMTLPRRLLR